MIPVFDATRDYREHRDEYLAAFERVMTSGRLILGPEVEAFEQEFAASVGASFAIGVNSGTDALILALRALVIHPGDEILVPALCAPATAAAVRAAGAIPRFVDVCPITLTIAPESVERTITARTKALIVVHLHGTPAALTPLVELSTRRGLLLIEDAAQAHGTTYAGRPVGTFGAIGCFSFYPTKNLGAFGDGGMCVTNDPRLDRRLRQLRQYGFDDERVVQFDGLNSRLDELQAAFLRIKLRRLATKVERRRTIADRYAAMLARSSLRLPMISPDASFHQFVVRVDDRSSFTRLLAEADVGYGLHYDRPLHQMPAYRFGTHSTDLPHAEAAAREVVSLPMFAELTDAEIERTAAIVRHAANRTAIEI